MAIIPDTKDWTWVLTRPCPECGFDTSDFPREALPTKLRSTASAWSVVLTRPTLTERPDPQTWSPLEYACHVRDTMRVFAARLDLMLTEDDPIFPNWDQDQTAVDGRYNEQDPAEVGSTLVAVVESVAAGFEAVADDQWHRPAQRSDGAVFTVETLGRYLVHDPVHHLHDVGAVG
jgi:hypothetical protein